MRKLIKTILAVSIVMAMGVTAMAAPSISNTIEIDSSSVKTANGATVNLIVSSPSKTVTAAEAVELLELDTDSDNVAVVVKDISLSEYDASVFPITFTMNVGGVTASSSVYVLHYTSAGEWVEEEATAGDGTVTITVSELSPIAIVVEDASTTTAPQTGEFGMTAVMALAVLALGTAVVASRKKTV